MKSIYLKNKEILLELSNRWGCDYSIDLPNKRLNFFNNTGELNSIKGFSEIVQNEIQTYIVRDEFDFESLSQILIALGIDSESVQVEDIIESNFSGKNLLDLILIGLSHPWKEVRWQVIEILGRSEIENKISLLYYALENERHTYVLRVGLKILSELNKILAKKIGKEHLESEDSYLRILSKDITELP